MEGSSPEDISNAARGHKANLSNPSAYLSSPPPLSLSLSLPPN